MPKMQYNKRKEDATSSCAKFVKFCAAQFEVGRKAAEDSKADEESVEEATTAETETEEEVEEGSESEKESETEEEAD